MLTKRSLLLSRLRRAIQKVRFLLSFNTHKWILSSLIGYSPGGTRRLSFKDRPSLLDCTSDVEDYCEVGSSFGISRTGSSASSVISRTISSSSEISRSMSDASSSDDIDGRAEMFIANFHRHIQMERQVSLQLRYCNLNI